MVRTAPRSAQLLGRRLLSAAVGLPLLLLASWAGYSWVVVLAAVAAPLAAREFEALIRAAGFRLLPYMTPVLSVLLVAAAAIGGGGALVVVLLAEAVLLLAATLMAFGASISRRAGLVTLGGTLYLGLPLSAAVLLRQGDKGWEWLFVALLATFAVDTAAYAVGTLMGRTHMAPSVSPGKTWEGAIGGLVGGTGATVGLVTFLGLASELWEAIALGVGISIAAQVGDLAESKLKRLADAKESGMLIPGHGGLLDRMDSLVLVFPLVYYVAMVWPLP